MPLDNFLVDIVRNGALYSVGQLVASTAVNGAQFVLWLPPAQNRTIYLADIAINASPAINATMFMLTANPGLAAGNTPGGLNPPQAASVALFQAAAAPQPAVGATIARMQLTPDGIWRPILHSIVRLVPNNGILISTDLVASNVTLTLVWAELSTDWERSV